jgi:hypothetical protein
MFSATTVDGFAGLTSFAAAKAAVQGKEERESPHAGI